MLLWQVSWSHCANPSPKKEPFIFRVELNDGEILFLNEITLYVDFMTPWVITKGVLI